MSKFSRFYGTLVFHNHSNFSAATLDRIRKSAAGLPIVNQAGDIVGRIEHTYRSDDAGRPIITATFVLDSNYHGGQVRIIAEEPIRVVCYGGPRT
jgi:hypothetical protein